MKIKLRLAIFTSFAVVAGISTAQAASVDGVIMGAQCYLQNSQCVQSKNDPRLVLENDFVLVSGNDHYFLPNLPRPEKLKVYNEKIRIEGVVTGNVITADKLFSTKGNKETVIWDEEEIYNDLFEG